MYKRRRKAESALPTTRDAYVQTLESGESKFSRTLKEEQFYRETIHEENETIVVFASPTLCTAALPQARELLIDSTFYVVPRQFYQLCTIHVDFDGCVSFCHFLSTVCNDYIIF